MADQPNMLAEESFETVLQRMLDRLPSDFDKTEGGFVYDILAPVSLELVRQRDYFRHVAEQRFATTAEGEYLDQIAADHGLTRNPAVPAKVVLEFRGQIGTVIPRGTVVATEDGQITFATDVDAVIEDDGIAITLATCTVAGSIGNVAAHRLTVLASNVDGVTAVDNPEPATGGLDPESDESLRQRILYVRRNPERGGTLQDYERWALSVAGVTYAKAIDVPRGIGSVDVVIAGDATQIDALVQQVQELIDLKKPCGVDAKVRKVRYETHTVRLSVTGMDAATAQEIALAFLNNIPIGGTVVLSRLVAELINKGAQDVAVIEPTTNIQLPPDTKLAPVVLVE